MQEMFYGVWISSSPSLGMKDEGPRFRLPTINSGVAASASSGRSSSSDEMDGTDVIEGGFRRWVRMASNRRVRSLGSSFFLRLLSEDMCFLLEDFRLPCLRRAPEAEETERDDWLSVSETDRGEPSPISRCWLTVM